MKQTITHGGLPFEVEQPNYDKKQFTGIHHILITDQLIPSKFSDYSLINRKLECEFHMKPDWLLIYRDHGKYLSFIDTGSHSDLFNYKSIKKKAAYHRYTINDKLPICDLNLFF